MNIKVENEKQRIDQFLSQELNISRTKIQESIKNGQVLVNGSAVNPNYKLSLGDTLELPDFKEEVEILKKEDIPLDIVYEDKDLLVINKLSSMVVHPAAGNKTNTLVNALLNYTKLSSNEDRPGIIHRLDKDTSGLLIVAKNDDVHKKLVEMLKERKITRKYLALVEGVLPHETGTIDAPIGRDEKNRQKMAVTSKNSKEAITHFRVLERYEDRTLLECSLETGRTHQIRVHLAYIKHPIVNDPLYGSSKKTSSFGQALHSYKLEFIHPISKKEIKLEQAPPIEFEKLCKKD